MRHRTAIRIGALIAAAGTAVAMVVPAQAAPTTSTTATVDVAPELLAAMRRDLGLTAEQATARLASEYRASRLAEWVRSIVADQFAGAWLSEDGATLTVAVTDPARTAAVRTAGARVVVVSRSERELHTAQSRLDAAAATAPAEVAGWYVDVASNSVVVLASSTARGAAARFVAAAGVDPATARVRVSAEVPQTLYDVRGGDAVYMGNGRCSIGFSVEGGFVTAGHCGQAGTGTQGTNQIAQGTFQGSSFPGNDYAWVKVNSNWTPTGLVNRYNGGTVSVAGASEAAVGASICRSGSTTGWRCGTVQAKNATVRYSQGTVNGLTRTSACAEPGDSGGSWLSGDQAQGVTSGGSGNCSIGGTTYFQPVNEILSAYGLRLVTS